MKKLEYVLREVEEPLISGNHLMSDRGLKGITLTYEVNHFKRMLKIGKLNIFSPIAYKSEIRTYFRPLKQTWAAERGRLPKNYWGKKSHPLCGVGFWWKMKSWLGDDMFDEQVKDHELIKRLRAATINEKEQQKKSFNPKRFYFYQ